jgi:hypothetical protein
VGGIIKTHNQAGSRGQRMKTLFGALVFLLAAATQASAQTYQVVPLYSGPNGGTGGNQTQYQGIALVFNETTGSVYECSMMFIIQSPYKAVGSCLAAPLAPGSPAVPSGPVSMLTPPPNPLTGAGLPVADTAIFWKVNQSNGTVIGCGYIYHPAVSCVAMKLP